MLPKSRKKQSLSFFVHISFVLRLYLTECWVVSLPTAAPGCPVSSFFHSHTTLKRKSGSSPASNSAPLIFTMTVPHQTYITPRQLPRLCWPLQFHKFVNDCTLHMVPSYSVPFWYVAQFCIPCGHFSASHSNGLPARLHCCGFCHLQIHSSTDLPSPNEKHMQCIETGLHKLCHMLHTSWTLTLCITNQ